MSAGTGLARAVATVGGVGRLRPAPGSWGSAAVLPAALLGPWACLGLALLCCALAAWALPRLPDSDADPGWIVVDEAAGQLLALSAIPASVGWTGSGWFWVLAAFALFRLFDVLKPGPIRRAERLGGALGVMADDLLAGVAAAALLLLARAVLA